MEQKNGAAAHVAQDRRARGLPTRADETGTAYGVDTPVLPPRTARDIGIDDAWHRMAFATTLPSRLIWARRMVAIRRGSVAR